MNARTMMSAHELAGAPPSVAPPGAQGEVIAPEAEAVARPHPEGIVLHERSWLWRELLSDKNRLSAIMLASLIANTMAMAGIVFSMQVYDRVIPANSYNTLYVLFVGVLIAAGFDFTMRMMRIRLIDVIGKIFDYRMSDMVFGQALRIKSASRPRSTGTFIAQLRDMDQIREMMTSTTLSVIADLPFFLLFLVVFWSISGNLAAIPAVALLFIIVPGLFLQPTLARLSRQAMKESALRNGLIVETIHSLDDVKATRSEETFHARWNHYNHVAATASIRLRSIVNGLTAWTQTVQATVFAVVVLFGAPQVMNGDMTTGVLVACSILASRMLAPMGSVSQLIGKWQHARAAVESINHIMSLPSDRDDQAGKIQRSSIQGAYDFDRASFHYQPGGRAALYIEKMHISPGERIAVLGRNGAGKSSFLAALAGLLEPEQGLVTLDEVTLAHIDPGDVRRQVGWLSQSASLFYGSIRENVTLGMHAVNDDAVIAALDTTGAMSFINRLERGLDHVLQEGGKGLSEGQKQSILLARLLVREPAVILLDEPSASLDEVAEKALMQRLDSIAGDRTLIVTTHRLSMLELVDRVIVLGEGRVVVDEPKKAAIDRIIRPR